MKNHRWIAQELRKDHAQITNKTRTSAHRHEKAPNRANAWLCVTNTRRKTTHNQRTVASELRMNHAWFTQARNMRHMSANRQWKVVDERYSGNVFTDDHWYSTHIPRIVRVRTTRTTQKIRKTAQYCANFYAKPSFELLKIWNRVKHRYGEHRRTTAEVPRQKNWWNAQIADVSCKTRNLCVIHAFTRILGSVTGPLRPSHTLTQAWVSNHMLSEITYQFLNFNGCTVEV